MAEQQSNIKIESNTAQGGMNLDQSVSQISKGKLTYALNAAIENYDGNSVNYQNEPGNELCLEFPEGYQLIGKHFINEQNKHIFFLANPVTGGSEIGYMQNNDCVYRKLINADCLNFNIDFPIPKAVHKITNCSTQVYWPDQNGRRFLDLDNLPFATQEGSTICENTETSDIDCNKLKVQPNFSIPTLEVVDVISGGSLTAGTVQFAMQYADSAGGAYTSYYSITNPTPIANPQLVTADFNYPVGKSIVLNISNIDVTGYFQYFNLAVIKTVNGITSVELIGTYFIDESSKQIIYSGQNQTQIRLTIGDIFEKFPYYDVADDITSVQDILVWKGLTSIDRINYQGIANKIKLQWETWRIPSTEDYSNELLATNYRGYLRDEVYPFEIVFQLTNGKETDGFHIPGRAIGQNEWSKPDVPSTNEDFIGEGTSAPYWKIYNTAVVKGTDPSYVPYGDYKGKYQYGDFAYWESTEVYPCNDIYGELANQPIRHHKFPDVVVSPIFESPTYSVTGEITPIMQNNAFFPIGVKLNIQDVNTLIQSSNLTSSQKDDIIGFKIVRGDRNTNKSIVAKGILRNVGKYEREGTEYYFPNYPYNDLTEDPFLLEKSNAYNAECNVYEFTTSTDGTYSYTDCYTNETKTEEVVANVLTRVCSITVPDVAATLIGTISKLDYDTYELSSTDDTEYGFTQFRYPDIDGNYVYVKVYPGSPIIVQVEEGQKPQGLGAFSYEDTGLTFLATKLNAQSNPECYPANLSAFETEDSKLRHVFNSPETSFGQPFLGNVLKLESAIFGAGKGHFVEVKKNALYKLITKEAQEDALNSSLVVANIGGTFNSTAFFTAYQAYLQIYINGITRRNYGWSYNSIASYDYWATIQNNLGIKQRNLDISQYLYPGVQSVGEDINLNNFNRESSVYLKTDTALPYPSETNSLLIGGITPAIEDRSRWINSQKDCASPEEEFPISTVAYYAAIKNIFLNQWGQLYSYETIDTGFQVPLNSIETDVTIFGGDTFINKFSFKTKFPFFIDNRVGSPDDSDIAYDELGNVAYPQFWHSSRSILYDWSDGTTITTADPLKNIISIKAHVFDCPNNQLPPPDSSATPPVTNPGRTYYDGKMYMFAYGIPTFYCESSVNVDLRQAFNNKEGDFYPHVGSGIPDDWVQESFVPIVQDNTYYYNVTYSKQNKENLFTHLPVDWVEDDCYTNFPFKAIFSDKQENYLDNRVNNWLIYRPASFFDFPQNYGQLTALDGIQNKQVLARFYNKSLLYNALYTSQINTGGQVYLGQNLFSTNVPPLDFAETDLGYVGSQHKFLLKIPQGQVTIDAKRGQVFLLTGSGIQDISAFGSGMNRFFTDHLPFEILRWFPEIDIDNHFKGIGLHGVFDSKYDRIIITKLDYIPISNDVKYDAETKEFYIEIEYPQFPATTTTTTTNGEVTTTTTTTLAPVKVKQVISVTDTTYFCNKSWSLSFNLNTNSWVSFHSYIPNFYIAENNFFYSGINESCDLEIIAAEIIPATTTTSTTRPSFDCELVGEYAYVNCNLEGTAIQA